MKIRPAEAKLQADRAKLIFALRQSVYWLFEIFRTRLKCSLRTAFEIWYKNGKQPLGSVSSTWLRNSLSSATELRSIQWEICKWNNSTPFRILHGIATEKALH
jgi:hypothetical protein